MGAASGALPVGMFECQRARVLDLRMIGACRRARFLELQSLCAACLLLRASRPPSLSGMTWSTTKHIGSGHWSV